MFHIAHRLLLPNHPSRPTVGRLLSGTIDGSGGHPTVAVALRSLLRNARAQLDRQVEVRMRQASVSRPQLGSNVSARPSVGSTPRTRIAPVAALGERRARLNFD